MEDRKQCSRCKILKSIDNFTRANRNKDGYDYWCKSCKKQLKIHNKKHIKEQSKIYRKNNKEKIYETAKKWVLNNRNRCRAYVKQYDSTHKNKRKQYYINNKQKIFARKYKQRNIRLKTDINFKILAQCRSRIYSALKNNKNIKSQHTISLLNCTINELKQHLEKQFKEGMSWNNYGFRGWHIDHIKPCSSFDFSKPEEQQKCFHYTNLQPLWWKENLEKGDKII